MRRIFRISIMRGLLPIMALAGQTAVLASGQMFGSNAATASRMPRRILSDGSALQSEHAGSLHVAVNAVIHSSFARYETPNYSISFQRAIRDPHILAMIGATSALIVLLLSLCFCLFSRRNRYRQVHMEEKYAVKGKGKVFVPPTIDLSFIKHADKSVDIKFHTPAHFFRYINRSEISQATENFSESLIIGRGSFGTVYKGRGPGGSLWAVKRAHRMGKGTTSMFQGEVDVISKVSHRNLTCLLGYCTESGEKILVYEFVPSGTLRQHLDVDSSVSQAPLTFEERLEIAVGVARGLHYLHTYAKEPMCHQNVKSDKILLDGSKQPKLSDFGLSYMSHEETQHPKDLGYMDPDYNQTGVWTVHSDVYRYGVVLFEIITGQTAMVQRGNERTTLVKWANEKIYAHQMDLLFDPHLESWSSQDFLTRLARLARKCTFRNPQERPAMYEVVHELEDITAELAVEAEQAAIWDADLPDDVNMTPIPELAFQWSSPPIAAFPGESSNAAEPSGQGFRWPSPPLLELPRGPASKFPATTMATIGSPE